MRTIGYIAAFLLLQLGPRDLTVTTPSGTVALPGAFTVVSAPPSIASLAPTSGNQGTTVSASLFGANLSGASAVTFSGSGVAATIGTVTDSSVGIVVTIAANASATARSVTVTTPGGSATLASAFTVRNPQPTIGAIAPNTGVLGTTFDATITGTNLSGATSVSLGAGVTVAIRSGGTATSLPVTITIAATPTVPPPAPDPDPPSPPPSGGGVAASSCQLSAVQAAIAAAPVNGIVNVPAGNCSWSGGTFAKAVRIRGAGIGQSNIAVSGNTVVKQAAGQVRFSGFTFTRSGGGNQSKAFGVDGPWQGAEPVVFEGNRIVVSGSGFFALGTIGGTIIANNDVTLGWDDSFIQPKCPACGSTWSVADTMGTRDTTGKLNHYIENNTIVGGANQAVDADDGTRVVYRNNRATYSSFNSHGWATSSVGVRHWEVYDNQFLFPASTAQEANINWLIWIRGGTGVIFGNSFADIAGSWWGNKTEIRFSVRGAEDNNPQNLPCSQIRYPVPRQIGQNHDGTAYFTDPIHIWNNTGAQAMSLDWNWGNPCGFSFATFFAQGRDYVVGTPKPGYAPYAYPHPALSQ